MADYYFSITNKEGRKSGREHNGPLSQALIDACNLVYNLQFRRIVIQSKYGAKLYEITNKTE